MIENINQLEDQTMSLYEGDEEPVTYEMLAKRVAQGAALLDQEKPNWFEEINLGKLEMGSCKDCILGQLYSNYDEGADVLFGQWSVEKNNSHGFTIFPDVSSPVLWRELRECWVREIKKRRTPPKEKCTRYEGGMCGCSACAARADRGEL